MNRPFIFLSLSFILIFTHLSYSQEIPSTTDGSSEEDKFIVYEKEPTEVPDRFYPSGWMGDYGDIKIEYQSPLRSQSGRYCQKWSYTARRSHNAGWAAVSWQYPENNWGKFKGHDLTGYNKVSFWARGEEGGEAIKIQIGGQNDSLSVIYGPIILSPEWKQYTIDLSGEDLSNVTAGFCWTASKEHNPSGAVFYLDNIVYE